MRYRIEALHDGQRHPAVLTFNKEWTLKIAGRRFAVRPEVRKPADRTQSGVAGDAALRQLLEAPPDDIVLLICGTCEHFLFSGMSWQMSGGWAGYCAWQGLPRPGGLSPSLDAVNIVTPGCEHHSALPEEPPTIPALPSRPSKSRPAWWRHLLATVCPSRSRPRCRPWEEGSPGGPCPACSRPILLAARLSTPKGEVAVGRCSLGRRGCGAFWLMVPGREQVLAPREAEALRLWMQSCPSPQEAVCSCQGHQIVEGLTPHN